MFISVFPKYDDRYHIDHKHNDFPKWRHIQVDLRETDRKEVSCNGLEELRTEIPRLPARFRSSTLTHSPHHSSHSSFSSPSPRATTTVAQSERTFHYQYTTIIITDGKRKTRLSFILYWY